MKIGNGYANMLIPILAAWGAAGCGRSDPPVTPAPPMQARTGAAQLRAKLNAMSVQERLSYMKQNPGAARQMMGGAGPMGGSAVGQPGVPAVDGVGTKGP